MSFSVPRCSRPICGSTRSTTSPSSSSTRRSTPCAAGCCGPKLIAKLRMLCSVTDGLRGSGRRLLLVARQHVIRALPRREEVEVAEFLGEIRRLVHDARLVLIVADLDEAG